MSYTQLTQEQRYQIYAFLKIGVKQTKIAKVIGVHKSTISREVRRNTGKRRYRYKQAHRMAEVRHKKARNRIRPPDWTLVEEHLKEEHSPEQISGWLLLEECFAKRAWYPDQS